MIEVFSIASLFGLLAFVVGVIQLQIKHVRHIYLIDIPLSLLWIIHFILIGAHAGAIATFFAGTRSIAKVILPHKYIPFAIGTIALLMTASVLATYQNIYSLLPLVANLMICYGTLGTTRKKLTDSYALAMICWIAYGLVSGSLYSAGDAFLALLSCIIGKIRHEGFRLVPPPYHTQTASIKITDLHRK